MSVLRDTHFNLQSTYLNSAYFGPTPKRSREKIIASLDRTMDPSFMAFDEWFKLSDRVRSRFAQIMDCPVDNVALSTSVGELISHVANGLALTESDEILLMKGDYPSMILPWLVLSEQRRFKISWLEREEFLDPNRFRSRLSAKTRIAGVSHIFFDNGIRTPLAELGRIARDAGVLFFSDTSQSIGGIALDKDILKNVDILVGVAYKWLLGPYGSAYGYFSEQALRAIPRTHASWLVSPNSRSAENLLEYTTDALPGARKFDRGQSASFLICAGLEGSLELIQEIGIHSIEAHNLKLSRFFVEHLPKSYSVAAPAEFRSQIICVRPQNEDSMSLKQRLADQGIDVSVREGRLRVSFHFFNTQQEVEALLSVLSAN